MRVRCSNALRPSAAASATAASLLMVIAGLTADADRVAAQTPEPCSADPAYAQLDFWVGEWTVWANGQQVGTNRIVKVMGGCAIEEHWEDARGGIGRSLFYYLPASERWRQVWVTPMAKMPGGVKEKTQASDAPHGSVRFQGTITRPDGTTYLDRTTLTPDSVGNVRQHIEISTDEGRSWRTTFDAEYRPAG